MKKLFVILVMTLLGYESIGAEKAPIMPRKANNAEYAISEAKTFVLNYGTVSDWFRNNMLLIINKGLTSSGEAIRVDASNVEWIFQHITYEFKDLGPYINSRLSDGIPEFFQDRDGWSGNVAVFRYGKCVIFLYKTQCMNLLDIPVKVTTPTVAYNPPPIPEPRVTDTVKTAGVTVINNIYNNNIISESGNSTNTISTPEPTQFVVTNEPNNNGFTREVGWGPSCCQQMPAMQPIMPMQGARGFVRLDINNRRQQVYRPQPRPQQPIPQRGYMGGGRPISNQGYMGGNNGNQGGGRGN